MVEAKRRKAVRTGLGGRPGGPRPPCSPLPISLPPLQPPSSRAGPKEISLLDLDDCEWPQGTWDGHSGGFGETEARTPGVGSCKAVWSLWVSRNRGGDLGVGCPLSHEDGCGADG